MRFRLPSRSSLPRAALTIGAGVLAGFLALPIVAVVLSLGDGASPVVAHLMDTVLLEHITNSLMLSLAVAIGTIAVGVPAAWFVTMHAFPGRRLLEIVLVLPLAMPAYVIAYAYTDLFQPAGPVQIFLRDLFALAPGTIVLPEIRSLPGAAIIFTAVLYPYVYLLARASFLEQSVCVLEASRTLGHGRFSTFFRVGLPLARPAIAAGTALALMETLADFGAVSYFGVQTFTTGIYRAWFSWGDPVAAQQLATGLLAFVLLLHALERISRGRARHFHATNRYRPLPHDALTGARGIGAAMLCALPGVFGFFLPVIALVRLAMVSEISPLSPRFVDAAGHSIILSLGAALIAVAGALIIAFAARGGRSLVARLASRIGELGYAVPGPVIAVGILVPLIGIDRMLSAASGSTASLVLTGSVFGLLYAYLVRFLAVALRGVDSGLSRVTPSMDAAAQVLARSPFHALTRVHAPIVAPSLLTAGLMVFVDVMKELPATLIMRPFNFDTLAVVTYNFASDERLADAAWPALAIVAAGLLPVILLMRGSAGARAGTAGLPQAA